VKFTRPRIRAVMPVLAAEGGDTRNLARLASRLSRANAAIEIMVDGAERYLALGDRRAASPSGGGAKTFGAKTLDAKTLAAKTLDGRTFETRTPESRTFDAKAFAAMPGEVRLRLLLRAIDRCGYEGPAELGKVEALLTALDLALAETGRNRRTALKQTLAGALVSLTGDRISVAPAPPRRRRAD
jgi:tRNA(Ile)-lysidine synthase